MGLLPVVDHRRERGWSIGKCNIAAHTSDGIKGSRECLNVYDFRAKTEEGKHKQ